METENILIIIALVYILIGNLVFISMVLTNSGYEWKEDPFDAFDETDISYSERPYIEDQINS